MRSAAGAASIFVFAVALALPTFVTGQEPLEPAPPGAEQPSEPAPSPPDEAAPTPSTPEEPPEPPPAPAEAAETTATVAPVAKGAGSVSMVDFAFSPATVTISVGDTVTWINNGEEDHDATGNGFGTGNVPPGGTGSATFSSAGSFSYICTIHPNMRGTVVVQGDSAGGPTGDGGTDPETGAPTETEEAAVASPDAAGTADALPASGEPEGPLVVLGLGLLGCGLMATALARWRGRESALPPPSR
jgi:plastocyanin